MMNKKFDIIMYTNASGLGTDCIEHAHRLPLIKGIAKAMEGIGKVLVILRYCAIPQCWFENNNNSLRTNSSNQLEKNLWAIRPTVIGNLVLASYLIPLRWQLRRQITNEINNAVASLNFTNKKVAWMTHPYHYLYQGCAGECAIVYECYDEHVFDSSGKRNKRTGLMESELARNAQLNIATAKPLFGKLAAVNKKTVLIPNGVMYDLFSQCQSSRVALSPELKMLKRPIIGMMGNLYHGYDFKLLNDIISKKKDWSFVFVGAVAENAKRDVTNLSKHSNFHLFGWRAYEELPCFLKGFDVAIIPYKVNEWTNTINPNKVYDYFAAGVPVVATPIEELLRLKDCLCLCNSSEEFFQGIESAVKGEMHDKIQTAIEVAKNLSWEKIAENILEEICQCALITDKVMSKNKNSQSVIPAKAGIRRKA